jgi:hypothetical protein
MTAAGKNLTDTDDEMRVAFRQMAMTFAQLEKTRLVKKLKRARDEKSQKAGRRVEGRKGYTRGNPKLVKLATSIWKQGCTLLRTSELLAEQGYVTKRGKPSVLGSTGEASGGGRVAGGSKVTLRHRTREGGGGGSRHELLEVSGGTRAAFFQFCEPRHIATGQIELVFEGSSILSG